MLSTIYLSCHDHEKNPKRRPCYLGNGRRRRKKKKKKKKKLGLWFSRESAKAKDLVSPEHMGVHTPSTVASKWLVKRRARG